jgi:hypothetical protein
MIENSEYEQENENGWKKNSVACGKQQKFSHSNH